MGETNEIWRIDKSLLSTPHVISHCSLVSSSLLCFLFSSSFLFSFFSVSCLFSSDLFLLLSSLFLFSFLWSDKETCCCGLFWSNQRLRECNFCKKEWFGASWSWETWCSFVNMRNFLCCLVRYRRRHFVLLLHFHRHKRIRAAMTVKMTHLQRLPFRKTTLQVRERWEVLGGRWGGEGGEHERYVCLKVLHRWITHL